MKGYLSGSVTFKMHTHEITMENPTFSRDPNYFMTEEEDPVCGHDIDKEKLEKVKFTKSNKFIVKFEVYKQLRQILVIFQDPQELISNQEYFLQK